MALTLRSHLVTAVCCAATLLATGTAPVVAQPVGPSPAEQVRRDTAAIRDIGVSGVQARMIGADARQSVATSGTGDLRTGRPVSAAGYFRMAGTSKTMVATVVLQLEAEGRLSLDDTVDDWLPGVVDGNGNDGRRISLRHLLQHTSGIRDAMPGYTTPEEYYQQRYTVYEPQQLIESALCAEGLRAS
ncbi:serine hydrolase domain-containing protein [Streptomyces globisporus]